MRFYCLLLTLFLILFLSACTTSGKFSPDNTSLPTASSDQPNQTKISAQYLTFWQLKGKIAIQTNAESGSAIVNWTQEKHRFNLSLLSPLGTTALNLSGQPGHVLLSTSDGKQITAETPEQLLVKVWGWHLPVSYLQYWVRGLPAPGLLANKQYDHLKRLTYLKQGEWQIQFLNYSSVGQIDLPNRLTISSPTLQTKIVIHEWKIERSS
jgi:outer membrane lipoprotein LolB